MRMREDFESAIKANFGDSIDYRRCENGEGEYMSWGMQVAWWSWQASREDFVVELPGRKEPTSSGHYGEGYLVPSFSGSALDYDDTVDAIRAAGITVKGDGDE